MRIALISDIHFGKKAVCNDFSIEGEQIELEESHNARPLYDGMIEILKNEKPEYLFVAGDLTSSGSPIEYKYCYEKIIELGKSINVDKTKIVFCLGNHDVDWRISDIKGQYSGNYSKDDLDYVYDFYQALSYQASIKTGIQNDLESIAADTFLLPQTGVIEYENCIVFVLNSSHQSASDQKYKHGYLSAEQLEWFSTAAKRYKENSKLKIVLLHHHPFNYSFPLPGLDISTLEEGSEIIKTCGECGIDIVIHGHRHQPQAKTRMETGWEKAVTYICAGSLSVNATDRSPGIPNTFHLIDYQGPAKIILKNFSYTPIDGWFPSTCSSRTPVDGIMQLGKTITEADAISIIKTLPHNTPIDYLSINDDLKYLTITNLMELIRRVHNDAEVFDNFPNNIMIFREE